LEAHPATPSHGDPLIRPTSRLAAATSTIVLLGALLAPVASAATPGYAFLEIPTGARASALGGAYATLGLGVESAYWNPAGLEQVKGVQVVGGHYELFQNLRHDHFAVAWRMFGMGVSGSVRALYSEPIDERDVNGNLIGSFGSHDLEFSLGLGGSLAEGWTAGVSSQILRERIASSSATTYSFGLGTAYQPARWPKARAGLQVTGLGPAGAYRFENSEGVTAEGEAVPLPTAVQGGVSYHFDVSNLVLHSALEARAARGRNAIGLVGLELAHPSGAALRVGLRANDDVSTFSAGAGYAFKALRLDYAWVPLQLDLGDTHRFSFATQF
jgi:hypothetical protein